MNWVSNIVVFSILWWIVLFMVLPIGVQTDPNPQKGCDTSAPLKAMIGRKLTATTGISIILWYIVKYIIEHELIKI
jgi:predicted secreted protein